MPPELGSSMIRRFLNQITSRQNELTNRQMIEKPRPTRPRQKRKMQMMLRRSCRVHLDMMRYKAATSHHRCNSSW